MAERKEQKKEAPWVEVYKDFHVMELLHGCLVKYGDSLTFIPGAVMQAFLTEDE